MSLKRDDVLRVAELAHLRLTEEEINAFGGQLSSILDYVSQLSQADVAGIEPVAHITGVSNVLRDDALLPPDPALRHVLLDAAPAREGDLVKVKAVFK